MNIALILSGGRGTRMGTEIPKQYIEVENKPVLAYVLEIFEAHTGIDKIQIAAEEQWRKFILSCAGKKFSGFSAPGETRQLSILNGLEDILQYAETTDNVIIHDAARPLVSEGIITRILDELETHEGVTPILPMRDTIYTYENGRFTGTAKREVLAAGQAPEGFKLGKYYKGIKTLPPEKLLKLTGSLQAALEANMDAVPVQGEEDNFKVTTMEDLNRFRQVLKERRQN